MELEGRTWGLRLEGSPWGRNTLRETYIFTEKNWEATQKEMDSLLFLLPVSLVNMPQYENQNIWKQIKKDSINYIGINLISKILFL